MARSRRRQPRPTTTTVRTAAGLVRTPLPAAPSGSWVDRLATREVPTGVEFTGILRTPGASPALSVFGVLIGIVAFLVFAPLVSQLLAAGYWLAIGSPGTFAETYAHLLAYEVPFGMVAAQLGIAMLIPISWALLLGIHHVRPAWGLSVRPGMRWRPLLVFVPVALVALNGVLWASNALAGRATVTGVTPGFASFLVAILLTSPLQAAAEEIFFRGYLLQALGSLSPNRWVGILASAGLFAVFHGTQNAWLFGTRFAFGVLAAVLVVYVGGLEAGIAAHVVNNVCAFVYAGLSTGIPALKATTTVSVADAIAEVAMYAVFTVAALGVARVLRLQRRTGDPGLGQTAGVR